jgi:hypothetical protein
LGARAPSFSLNATFAPELEPSNGLVATDPWRFTSDPWVHARIDLSYIQPEERSMLMNACFRFVLLDFQDVK